MAARRREWQLRTSSPAERRALYYVEKKNYLLIDIMPCEVPSLVNEDVESSEDWMGRNKDRKQSEVNEDLVEEDDIKLVELETEKEKKMCWVNEDEVNLVKEDSLVMTPMIKKRNEEVTGLVDQEAKKKNWCMGSEKEDFE